IASREPVDAPDGTAARPIVPLSSSTSHSTVGLPRLSRISRPTMSTIALISTPGLCSNLPGATVPAGIARTGSAREVVLQQRLRLDHAVERQKLFEQRLHVLERHGVRAVGQRM